MIGPSTVERGGFPTKPLGEVAEFLDHRRKPITAKDREPGPIPYYGANGQQDSVADWLFDEPLVLLAEDGGHFETPERGIAYCIGGKSWVNNHAHVLRAGSSVDTTWLTRVLENYDVTRFITGSTRAKLTKSGAARIPIPVPPLEEQRRIAAALDAADELRAKRREALAKLDSLPQSTFIDMFGSGGWPTSRLGDEVETKSGGTPSRRKSEFFEGSIPWVKSGEVAQGVVRDTEEHISAEAVAASSAKLMPPGTVLLAMYGATVGAVGELGIEATTNQAVCCITPSDTMSRAYLIGLLKSLKSELVAKGAGGAQPNISQTIIRDLRVPVPPVDAQAAYAARVQEVAVATERARKSKSGLDTLFGSLQQRAFRWEL